MIIAKLTITFDRGVASNKAQDIGLETQPTSTQDGGVVRGLGTHFRDEAARLAATERSTEEQRIRTAFKREFLASPIPGTYVLPSTGTGADLLTRLGVRPDIDARVCEYELAATNEALPPGELREWSERVKAQVDTVPLGRGKTAGEEGLGILERLASCPLLADETRNALQGIIAEARLERIDRIEVKRRIEVLDVQVDLAALAPRRAPVLLDGYDLGNVYVRPGRAVAV